MSDNTDFGFARLVPGFDFLQNLAKGAAAQGMPQMPSLSSWVAPTLNVEELEKRIAELKAVHFWLDQNGKALSATIQALEVQKMTLATLQGMNFNMGEMAEALRMKPAAAPAPAPAAAPKGNGSTAAGAVDPLQWWSSLTQQFQEIAATAMKDVAQHAANAAPQPSTSTPEPAKKTARAAPARKAAAPKPAPAKAAPRKRAAPAA